MRSQLNQLRNSNIEWESKTKKLFVEVQQMEIMQEKRDYERKLRMSEMATLMKDQKKRIRELEEEIQVHEESMR